VNVGSVEAGWKSTTPLFFEIFAALVIPCYVTSADDVRKPCVDDTKKQYVCVEHNLDLFPVCNGHLMAVSGRAGSGAIYQLPDVNPGLFTVSLMSSALKVIDLHIPHLHPTPVSN